MTVERISTQAIKKVIGGDVKTQYTCVIKVYSNGCPICHELKDEYHRISNLSEFDDLYFFVFNIDDFTNLDKLVEFEGVPTFILVNTGLEKSVHVMQEPPTPHPKTWYYAEDIVTFVNDNRRGKTVA